MQHRATLVLIVAAVAVTASKSLLRRSGPQAQPLYIQPVVAKQNFLGPISEHTPRRSRRGAASNHVIDAKAEWFVAQWNNNHPFTADDLPPNTHVLPRDACGLNQSVVAPTWGAAYDPLWGVATEAARICVGNRTDHHPGETLEPIAVQLASTGVNALKCGVEFDMFLSPVGQSHAQYKPKNIGITPPLSNLSALEFLGSISLAFLDVKARCGSFPQCGPKPDYGYITIGVPMDNVKSRETIFYQVEVFDSRWKSCGGGSNPCSSSSEPGWYFKTNPFGVDYKMNQLRPDSCIQTGYSGGGVGGRIGGETDDEIRRRQGERWEVRFLPNDPLDLLPTMKESIQHAATHLGADGDLDHWTVGGLYVGHGLQGSTTMTTNMAGIDLRYTEKP